MPFTHARVTIILARDRSTAHRMVNAANNMTCQLPTRTTKLKRRRLVPTTCPIKHQERKRVLLPLDHLVHAAS